MQAKVHSDIPYADSVAEMFGHTEVTITRMQAYPLHDFTAHMTH